jgi:nucleoside-diphosphate-sugar epimerase
LERWRERPDSPSVQNLIMNNPLADDLEFVLACTEQLWEEVRGARLFITGGTGWVGTWLLESFCWANSRLDLRARATVLSRDPGAFARVAPHLASDPALTFHAGDIRNFSFPQGSFSHIVHAATESSAKLNGENPALMLDTIVQGTRRCLEFAARSGARKFLLTSSGAVYGRQPCDLAHVPETFMGAPDPVDPTSAYHEGKRVAELQCVLLGRSAGFESKVARCFTFVGPYMKLDAHFAIGNFLRDHLKGGPIVVEGDGTAVRSYMYMADLLVWLWTILFRGVAGRAYNVGSEDAICISELAQQVAQSVEPPVGLEIRGKAAPGSPAAHRYVPDTARARTELGLQQQFPLTKAIIRTHAWFRAKGSAPL